MPFVGDCCWLNSASYSSTNTDQHTKQPQHNMSDTKNASYELLHLACVG